MTQIFRAKELASHGEIVEHVCDTEPTPKEISVVFGGETIARSRQALIMHETRRVPVYYFPLSDVRMEFLEPTDKKTH